jgi:hypothetical protein
MLFVNSWAQVRSPCSSAKAVCEPLKLLGVSGNLKRWSLLGGLQVIGGMPLKDRGTPVPSSFLFASQQ